MTRRELLTSISSSVAMRTLRAQNATFDRIDAHAHIFRSVPAVIASLEKDNWRALTICIWEQFDARMFPSDVVAGFKTLDELHRAAAKVHRESRGRIAWAATIDARGFENRGFTEETIANLQRCFQENALGVKIWQIIGMKVQGKSGNYLLPDDKSLMPVYQAIQKADRTLIAHIAAPIEAWLPVGTPGLHADYYKSHPQWRVGNQPEAPGKKHLLESRDRILARFPKLRVVGCHLGSNEEELKALARRLDTYPNFSVDISARIRDLLAADRETVRQFIEKYQDRLIYGSDATLNMFYERTILGALNRRWSRLIDGSYTPTAQEDERTATSLLGALNRAWNLFASNQITQRNPDIRGFGLSEKALRKIFHDNAVRMLPGIA